MTHSENENSVETRRKRATQRETALRDSRLIRALASGQPIEEAAARENLSLRQARERVSIVLSRRADPPAEFAQMQIRRLSEAMLVAYAAMKGGNLQAVDRVLRITREFERYYGFAMSAPPAPSFPPAFSLSAEPLALPPPQNDEAT